MSNLVFRLPMYYQRSAPVSELERVLGEAVAQLMASKSDTLDQLFVETATWEIGNSGAAFRRLRRAHTAGDGSACSPNCAARARPRQR